MGVQGDSVWQCQATGDRDKQSLLRGAASQALLCDLGHFCLGWACGSGSGSGFPRPRSPAPPPQVLSWKAKLPLQTIMRLLQVLVPQVEKICIDK